MMVVPFLLVYVIAFCLLFRLRGQFPCRKLQFNYIGYLFTFKITVYVLVDQSKSIIAYDFQLNLFVCFGVMIG